MATKDISDIQVCRAYAGCKGSNTQWPYQILQKETGQCEKVCCCAMERAFSRGLIDYGVSLRSGWLTEKGEKLIRSEDHPK